MKQSQFPEKHFQHKQNCANAVQKRLPPQIWTGDGSIQKLRVSVRSWENTLSDCKNLTIVYQEQIEQKKILTRHCENAFSPVGISDYQTYSYESFGKTWKFLPWLLSTQNKLLASVLGKLSICCKASEKKNVSVLNHLREQLLPQGFCLQFKLLLLFCTDATWHIPQQP